ncbi:unnamed protein product, partial [Thlaspi arvense]
MLVRIPNASVRKKIVDQEIWHIGSSLFYVAQWSAEIAVKPPSFTSIPLWAQVKGIPFDLYTQEGIGQVTDLLGFPVECDEFTRKMVNINIAHIKFKADCTKPLPTYKEIERENGEIVPITVEYPWVPPICPCCKQLGHSVALCPNGQWAPSSANPVNSTGSSPATSSLNKVASVATSPVPGFAVSSSISRQSAPDVVVSKVAAHVALASEEPIFFVGGSPLSVAEDIIAQEASNHETLSPLGKGVVDFSSIDITGPADMDKISHLIALPALASFRPVTNRVLKKASPLRSRYLRKTALPKSSLSLEGVNPFACLDETGSIVLEGEERDSSLSSKPPDGDGSCSDMTPVVLPSTDASTTPTVVSFGALLEIHIKEPNLNHVLSAICPNWSFLSNHATDEDGRIIIIWRQPFSVVLLHQSKQTLSCKVRCPGILDFIYTVVYTANTSDERNDLWIELLDIEATYSLSNSAWLVGGDFNEILHLSEHSQPSSSLRKLNKDNFSDIQKRVNEVHEMLNAAQLSSLNDPTPTNLLAEREYNDKLTMLRTVEEEFFKKKSRINWLQTGDQNTPFYHSFCKARNAFNTIHTLTGLDGRVAITAEDVGNLAASHFRNILGPRIGLSTSESQLIENSTGIPQGFLPIRYLGLPLCSKKLSIINCEPLLHSIKNIKKYLSFARRQMLINTGIAGITNFWCSAFVLPKECICQIDSMCNAYLWKGTLEGSFSAKIAWVTVTSPKEEGGLGMKNLSTWNRVCSLKLLWLLLFKTDFIWVAWIHQNKSRAILDMFRKLLRLRDTIMTWVRIRPGDGITCMFWSDLWTSFGPLIKFIGPLGPRLTGITRDATVASVWINNSWRLTPARSESIEALHCHLTTVSLNSSSDQILWQIDGTIKTSFSSKIIYHRLRMQNQVVDWSTIMWLKKRIPKHKCLTYLTILAWQTTIYECGEKEITGFTVISTSIRTINKQLVIRCSSGFLCNFCCS